MAAIAAIALRKVASTTLKAYGTPFLKCQNGRSHTGPLAVLALAPKS